MEISAQTSKLKFSTEDVALISGATIRKLQWWCEKGLIEPDIVGHNRSWDFKDLSAACMVTDMRSHGIGLVHASIALRKIEARGGRYALVEYLGGETGSPRVVVGDSLPEIATVASEWGRPVVIIDRDVRGRLKKGARKACA